MATDIVSAGTSGIIHYFGEAFLENKRFKHKLILDKEKAILDRNTQLILQDTQHVYDIRLEQHKSELENRTLRNKFELKESLADNDHKRNKELEFIRTFNEQSLFEFKQSYFEQVRNNKIALDLKNECKNETKQDLWPIRTPLVKADLLRDKYYSNTALPIEIYWVNKNYALLKEFEEEVMGRLKCFFHYIGYNNKIDTKFGDWKPNMDSDVCIGCLWEFTQFVPTIVIEPEIFNKNKSVKFNIYQWGNNLDQMTKPIPNETNAIDLTKNKDDFIEEITKALILNIGCSCDLFRLTCYNEKPILPYALKNIKRPDVIDSKLVVPEDIVKSYILVLGRLSTINYWGDNTPWTFLEIIDTILEFDFPNNNVFAQELLKRSIVSWEKVNNILDNELPATLKECYKRILNERISQTEKNNEFRYYIIQKLISWNIISQNEVQNLKNSILYFQQQNDIYHKCFKNNFRNFDDLIKAAFSAYNEIFYLQIKVGYWNYTQGFNHGACYHIAEELITKYYPRKWDRKSVDDLAREIFERYTKRE